MSTTASIPRGLRRRTSMAVAVTLFASLTVAAVGWSLHSATPAFASAESALSVPGEGATVPFTEYEAEDSTTNATVLPMNRNWDTLAGEASGRSAVTLSGAGKYVQFTLTKSANAVDVHYSIPDTGDGSAYTQPLAVYVNGTKTTDLTLTNKYDWFYGGYPFGNTPGNNPHHMYDDVRTLFGSTLPVGTQVKFQVDTGAQPVTIDTADFEVATQYTQPAGSLSAANYGIDPSGATDSTAAMQNAVNAASAAGQVLWVPAGTYTLYNHVIVNNVTVMGAGPWYTVFGGQDPNNLSNAGGFYGRYVNGGGYTGATNSSDNNGPSTNVTLEHFAIIDNVTQRDDSAQVNGLGGAMSNSTVNDLWIQHTKVGAWMDGPMTNFTIENSRILDTTADGVNFHFGVTNSMVSNTFVRNTGDDGLATWADSQADSGDVFDHDTVEMPMLANNIAIYGGSGNSVTNDVVADTQTQGGGITVAQRFSSTPLSGTTTISNDTTLRAGVLDPNWLFGVGALWFDAEQGGLSSTINVTNVNLIDSSYEGIQTVEGSSVTNVNLTNVDIDGAGTFAFQLQTPGSFTANHVTSEYIGQTNQIYSCLGTAFTFNLVGTTNGAWTNNIGSTFCNGTWPTPVYTFPEPGNGPTGPPSSTPPPPPTGNLTVTPSSLTFGTQTDGTTSAAQAVSIKNTGTAAAPITGLSTAGDFAQTNNCGTSLAINATCTANVTFTPTAGGTRAGSLNITSSTPGSPNVVNLTGTGFDPNANLAQGKTITDTGHNDVYVATNANDGNTGTYWESTNNAFPQSLTVDLGAAYSVSRVVLFLPPTWGARTETLSILGSTDNSTYNTLSASTGWVFDPTTGDTVTIPFTAASDRYIRLTFTGNTGWPAGQLSEFQVFANGGGSAPALSYSPSSLTFGSQTVGTTSAAQSVTITNTGTATADLSGFSATGDFAQTHTCGATLAANATCTVSATFTPTATGNRTGSIVVTSNAPGSPQSIALSGTGAAANAPALSYSPSSLTFGSQTVGTTSAGQSVTITNTGTASANLSGFSATGDFAQTHTCGATLAANATCTVSATFTPTATGTRTGSIVVTSNVAGSPQSIGLTGTGTSNTPVNLALGKTMTTSGYTQTYAPGNANDNNTSTYWESTDNAFPQWIQVDLGANTSVGRLVLDLPPATSWATRTQTLSVQGSTNGTTFTNIVGSAGYTFNPATGNTVTITFTSTSTRYIRLNFTANTGWPAGQLSEFQVWAS